MHTLSFHLIRLSCRARQQRLKFLDDFRTVCMREVEKRVCSSSQARKRSTARLRGMGFRPDHFAIEDMHQFVISSFYKEPT